MSILILDDDPALLEALCKKFKSRGLTCLTAGNGRDGVNLLHRDSSIQVVLSDIDMPILNGIGFLSEARALFGNLPIFLMSADIDNLSIDPLGLGATDAFSKLEIDFERIILAHAGVLP